MELTDISTVKELLARHGFRFSKALGQNFLTAAWVPERIAEESGADAGVGVVEVGPGVGCLTKQLALRAEKVVAVELDRRLIPLLGESLAGLENVEVLNADALKLDLRALAEEKLAGLRPTVCSNLPYNITTPLLTAFLEAGVFERVTVMVQREVARRICAEPATADYGAFTVFANWHAEPEMLFDVSPGCFMPQPKVTSCVLRLTPRSAPPCPVESEELLFRTVRAAFAQRRKTLLNALSSGFPRLGRDAVSAAIESAGVDPQARGETLGIAEFAALSDSLGQALKN